jgi:hypothetical protein
MAESIWELEAEVRRTLFSGVNFDGRIVATAGLDDDVIKWVKLEPGNPTRLRVVYVKGTAMVTVTALIRDDGKVDVTSVSLDRMCGCGGTYA